MKATSRDHRLRAEHLEDRWLLAGDVLASLDGNTLELTGDDEGNEIAIAAAVDEEGEVIEGSYVVTGLNGTTVNGEAEATFEDVHSIAGEMGDGDDIVQLTHAVVPGNFSMETGAGADQVWVGHFPGQPVEDEVVPLAAGVDAFLALDPPALPGAAGAVGIGHKLYIDTGDDDDIVAVSDALAGQAKIETGDGDDSVFLLAMSDLEADVEALFAGEPLPTSLELDPDRGLEVHGKLQIDLGTGDDGLTAMHVSATKGIFVDAEPGTEYVLSNVDGGRRGLVINGPGNGGFGGGFCNGPFGSIFGGIRDAFDNGLGNGAGNGFGGFGNPFRAFGGLGGHGFGGGGAFGFGLGSRMFR